MTVITYIGTETDEALHSRMIFAAWGLKLPMEHAAAATPSPFTKRDGSVDIGG